MTEQIINAVSDRTGISLDMMQGGGKTSRIARARALAAYVMRKNLSMSYPAVGKVLNKDHSTLLYSVRRLESDAAFKSQADAFCESLRPAAPNGETRKAPTTAGCS